MDLLINGHAQRTRDGKVFVRNISMARKNKHNIYLDDHSHVDSSGSAEMETEDTHPDNRGSKKDSVDSRQQNVGSENDVCFSSCT